MKWHNQIRVSYKTFSWGGWKHWGSGDFLSNEKCHLTFFKILVPKNRHVDLLYDNISVINSWHNTLSYTSGVKWCGQNPHLILHALSHKQVGLSVVVRKPTPPWQLLLHILETPSFPSQVSLLTVSLTSPSFPIYPTNNLNIYNVNHNCLKNPNNKTSKVFKTCQVFKTCSYSCLHHWVKSTSCSRMINSSKYLTCWNLSDHFE